MKDKKHIDRVFQEKLKDLEVTPDKSVWDNLSKELNTVKKDRKATPLWWTFAGAAAIIILLLAIGNLIYNNNEANDSPTIVDEKIEDASPNIAPKTKKSENNTKLVDTEYLPTDKLQNNNTDNNVIPKKDNMSTNQDNITNQTKNKVLATNNKPNSLSNEDSVKKDHDNSFIIEKPKSFIASNEVKTESVQKNKKEGIPENEISSPNNIKEDLVNATEQTFKKSNEKTVKDIINDTEETIVEQDEKEKIPLTEDLAVNDDEIDEEEKETINRWQISPNVAPVYFDFFGKGSSIDSQFTENPKSGDINLSYGINASYAITDRLSVKAGINKLKLGYDTRNVIAVQGLGEDSSNSIIYRNLKISDSTNVMFLSASNVSLSQVPDEFASVIKTSLKQELGYIEVPLELEYSVIKKKVGVNVIGGFSFMFLEDNNVYTVVNDVKTVIGEATNINNTSYSANFGLGLDYNVSKNVSFNLDPMFKYQINTFNNTAGDFKPYFIGVYSGINVKF